MFHDRNVQEAGHINRQSIDAEGTQLLVWRLRMTFQGSVTCRGLNWDEAMTAPSGQQTKNPDRILTHDQSLFSGDYELTAV